MAVYKRSYKAYAGTLTPAWSRFFVIPRYAWRGLFKQRFLTLFYMACFFYPLGCALTIYLNHNLGFLAQYMPVPKNGLLEVGNKFFFVFTDVQAAMAFVLAAFVGPGLVSPDLANGALPLYFCRPFSRAEYITGKLAVLALLLSYITWLPGLALFGLQASLAGNGWWRDNLWIAGSLLASFAIFILLVSMLALALSAWVRWKIVAGALMLVIFFLGAGIAQTVKAVLRMDEGAWFDLVGNLGRVFLHLFDIKESETIPVEEAVASLLAASAVSLYLLLKKVRAFEVVR